MPINQRSNLSPFRDSFIWQNREYIALAAVIAALCFGSYELHRFKNAYLDGLGPNLLAGFVGSAVTIFGFDVILRIRDARLRAPIRIAIYNSVISLCECGINPATLAKQFKHYDAHLAEDWKDILHIVLRNPLPSDDRHAAEQWVSGVRDQAELVLNRYATHLEPDAIKKLQVLADTEYELLRGSVLAGIILNNTQPTEEDWPEAVQWLHKWSWGECKKLRRYEPKLSSPSYKRDVRCSN
jgi:hypothetical protein